MRAGTVLGWGSGVIHWGSACHGAGAPRLAISQDFFAANSAPIVTEYPVLDGGGRLPTLMQRLHIIAKAILAYQSFEPLLIRYADFASELQKKTESTF